MLLSILLFAAAAAHPASQAGDGPCQNPVVRQEWRTLSADDQSGYIKAIQCLAGQPSKASGTNTTRIDDFARVHAALNNNIHFVASFLPWHRYFVHVYEQALRDCGYQGVAAYWDWSLDVSDPSKAPVWDAETGFGGNGSPQRQIMIDGRPRECINDGPLRDIQFSYYGGRNVPHCLMRQFNNGSDIIGDMFSPNYDQATLDRIHALPNYDIFRRQLESIPHGAIHSAVGGDMSPSTSPNDAIFFLHHTQIDRLWYHWQQENPDERTMEFGGIKTQDQKDGTVPPPASLDDILVMLDLGDDIKVRDMMSTQQGLLCYKYL